MFIVDRDTSQGKGWEEGGLITESVNLLRVFPSHGIMFNTTTDLENNAAE